MQRYDIINHLSKRFDDNFQYLEIGVDKAELCFDLINTNNKTGVEPKEELRSLVEFSMTSDEFFFRLENGQTRFVADFKWDIIFIDGLHLAYQTYRDIVNATNHINPNGFILVHDCNPPSVVTCHSDLDFFNENQGFWNGTAWKAMYITRTQLNRKTFTIDTDWGVGVIDMSQEGNRIEHTNLFFDYGQMKYNRREHLGLVTIDEFLTMYSFNNINGDHNDC